VKEVEMRVMMFVKGDPEPGQMPGEEMLAAMGKYNEELSKAGVLLDLNGLHPSSDGVRVRFTRDERTVIDGPFAESKEVVAGYWLLEVKSMDEAIEWAKRAPFDPDEYGEEGIIEIRPVFELEDFGNSPKVERARELGEELAAKRTE
jgi:hypothetical protein